MILTKKREAGGGAWEGGIEKERERQRGGGGVRCLSIKNDGSKSILVSRQESTVIHAYCVNDQGFLNI